MSAMPHYPHEYGYAGLRMTAEEYLALGETPDRYELIDGVVVLTPAPMPRHNAIATAIIMQLGRFASHPDEILVLTESDIRLGGDRVYRPDLVVYVGGRFPSMPRRLDIPPDLVVEVLSPGSKSMDLITKRDDYERFGVGEYWVVDPADGRVRSWTRREGMLAEAPVTGDSLASAAIPGFSLDLRRIAAMVGRD